MFSTMTCDHCFFTIFTTFLLHWFFYLKLILLMSFRFNEPSVLSAQIRLYLPSHCPWKSQCHHYHHQVDPFFYSSSFYYFIVNSFILGFVSMAFLSCYLAFVGPTISLSLDFNNLATSFTFKLQNQREREREIKNQYFILYHELVR